MLHVSGSFDETVGWFGLFAIIWFLVGFIARGWFPAKLKG